jgi:hypothetical protein
MSKVLGLVVKKPESVFSNGCVQQAYFLYKLLQKSRFNIELVSTDATYTVMEHVGVKIRTITPDTNYSRYGAIVFTSGFIRDEEMLACIRMHGVQLVSLICGNLFILHQEEYVFDVHHTIHSSLNIKVDENWLMPMYEFAKSYVGMLTNTPTHLVPYVWDTDFLDAIDAGPFNRNNLTHHNPNRQKINILIYEPNVSIHKTSLVPMLIANRYHIENPGMINRVYHFCSSAGKNQAFYDSLAVVQDGLVEFHPRMVLPTTLALISKNNPYVCVVLSHNILNDLNFMHLELFSMGIHVVHNCAPFASSGLYYPTYDLEAAVAHIVTAVTCPVDTASVQTIIKNYSPDTEGAVEEYDTRIAELFSRSEKLARESLHAIKKTLVTASVELPPIGEGNGVVTYVWDVASINRLVTTLRSCFLHEHGIDIHVFYSNKLLDVPTITRELKTLHCDYNTIRMCPIESVVCTKTWKAWMTEGGDEYIKPFAIMASPFKNVLYVTPGCILAQTVSVYFDINFFQERGSLFWAAAMGKHETNHLICFYAPEKGTTFVPLSTDVIMINKDICAMALAIMCKITINAEYFMYYLKSFHAAWTLAFKTSDTSITVVGLQAGIAGVSDGSVFIGKGIVYWLNEAIVSHVSFLSPTVPLRSEVAHVAICTVSDRERLCANVDADVITLEIPFTHHSLEPVTLNVLDDQGHHAIPVLPKPILPRAVLSRAST